MARSLAHPPTNFAEAAFTCATSPGALPADADLVAVIRGGRVERGMPPQPLPPDDLSAVVQFIKTLSPRWRSGTPEASN